MHRHINFSSFKSDLELFNEDPFVPNPLGFRNLIESNIRSSVPGRLDNDPLYL